MWTKEKALDYLYNNSARADNGCLEWQGSLTKGGYGQLGIDKLIREFGIKGTHRLMVHLTTGHEFAGRHEYVLHSCDNPCCIEPRHLSVGSPKDNVADCIAKGRYQLGQNAHNHRRTALTEDQVRTMKRMLAIGVRGKDVAAFFGCSVQTMSAIKNGRTWSQIDG